MHYVRIGSSFWSLNSKTGEWGSCSDHPEAEEITLDDSLDQQNLNYILQRRSTEKLSVDEKGHLKASHQGGEKARAVVEKIFNKLEVEVADKRVAHHFFYHVLRSSKIQLFKKESYQKKDRWVKRRLFTKDPLMDHLDVIVGKLFWSVNCESGLISQPRPLQERDLSVPSYDFADGGLDTHNLEKLFTRKENEALYVDGQGHLQTGWTRHTNKVKRLVNQALELYLKRADQAPAEVQKPLSHFLYHFMNREGVIGSLPEKIGYAGDRQRRLFSFDQMAQHEDIVIGDHFWRVNLDTQTMSKALSIQERSPHVKAIDLSGSPEINEVLKQLFERSGTASFRVCQEKVFRAIGEEKGCRVHEHKYALQPVKGLKNRVSHWWNQKREDEKVRGIVSTALQHLDGAVKGIKDRGVSLFLQKKFETKLAALPKEQFDRAIIKEGGGIEEHLDSGKLRAARDKLFAKLDILNRNKIQKLPAQEITEKLEAVKRAVVKDRVFEKVKHQGRQTLETMIQSYDLQEDLSAKLTFMTDLLAHRIVREQVIRSQDKEIAICELNKRLALEVEAKRIVEYTIGRIICQQTKDALLDLLIEEFLFTQKLGFKLEKVGDGGSGGARYARDRFGHKILVVKPDDEGPYGRNNPRWTAWIKQLFLKIRNCLAGNLEQVAEKSSYDVDQGFGFDIVPPTAVRKLKSSTFVRGKEKWCSVQAFIHDCKPFQDALFKTWKKKKIWSLNQNMRSRETLTKKFAEEGAFHLPLLEAIKERNEEFARAFARFILHNFLIGDTDCHFDNWFIKRLQELDPTVQEILSEQEADYADIQDLVYTKLLSKGVFYDLFDALFHAESDLVIIKHDGGSSMPRRHPTSNFEMRLAYLFEVLPQMEGVFANELKSLLLDGDRLFFETAAQVAIHNLCATATVEDFSSLWNDFASRKRFKQWLFTDNSKKEEMWQTALAEQLSKGYSKSTHAWKLWHYKSQLQRIKGIASTFKERWETLIIHLQQDDPSMKELFQVKKKEDFIRFRAKHVHNPAFTERMEIFEDALLEWTRVDVDRTPIKIESQAELQQQSERLMRGLTCGA